MTTFPINLTVPTTAIDADTGDLYNLIEEINVADGKYVAVPANPKDQDITIAYRIADTDPGEDGVTWVDAATATAFPTDAERNDLIRNDTTTTVILDSIAIAPGEIRRFDNTNWEKWGGVSEAGGTQSKILLGTAFTDYGSKNPQPGKIYLGDTWEEGENPKLEALINSNTTTWIPNLVEKNGTTYTLVATTDFFRPGTTDIGMHKLDTTALPKAGWSFANTNRINVANGSGANGYAVNGGGSGSGNPKSEAGLNVIGGDPVTLPPHTNKWFGIYGDLAIAVVDADLVEVTDNFIRVGKLFSTDDGDQTFTFDVPFDTTDGTTDEDIFVLLQRINQDNLSSIIAPKSITTTGFVVNRDNGIDGVGTTEPFTYLAVNKKALAKTAIYPGSAPKGNIATPSNDEWASTQEISDRLPKTNIPNVIEIDDRYIISGNSSVNGAGTINFPVSFANTNYSFTATARTSGGSGHFVEEQEGQRTNNSLRVLMQVKNAGTGNGSFSWTAIGEKG